MTQIIDERYLLARGWKQDESDSRFWIDPQASPRKRPTINYRAVREQMRRDKFVLLLLWEGWMAAQTMWGIAEPMERLAAAGRKIEADDATANH